MKATKIGKICAGQDGAIYGDLLFRLGSRGHCTVYDLTALGTDADALPIGEFMLDRADEIAPHSNAVFFGSEYYAEGDELPMLYSNIYNNFKNEPDRLEGVLCAYRITRGDGGFSSELVQLIEIGFTDSRELWRSPGGEDVRPYGNFIADPNGGRLYAFVMRDGEQRTRYFAFNMPTPGEGELCPRFGVPRAVLRPCDVLSFFDAPYHNYIQGACCRGRLIYSLEGFGERIHPMLRVIDTERGEELTHIDLYDMGLEAESELIDFYGERCIYADAHGNVFELSDIL